MAVLLILPYGIMYQMLQCCNNTFDLLVYEKNTCLIMKKFIMGKVKNNTKKHWFTWKNASLYHMYYLLNFPTSETGANT